MTINSTPLCIYHGNCADGFGAAWVVRQYFRSKSQTVDFHAGVYQAEPPNCKGRFVIVVDFSYKRSVMLEMMKGTQTVLVLDHHKTAMDDLKSSDSLIINMGEYLGAKTYERFLDNVALDSVKGGPRIYTVFDMERSGAGLTWDFFFSDKPRPQLINHIEDRDLWRFKYPDTRAIQANVFSYPYDFEVWDTLMQRDVIDLAKEGRAIERKHHKDIAELVQVTKRRMMIGGYNVPVANLPYTLTSDAGHLMCGGEPFACCYWDTPAGRIFSLRSTDVGVDVADVAKQYGGGGHRNASGFKMAYSDLAQFEMPV